jgi:hypothetical protein
MKGEFDPEAIRELVIFLKWINNQLSQPTTVGLILTPPGIL